MLEKYKEGMSRPQQQRDWNNILTQGNEPMKRLNTESRAALKNSARPRAMRRFTVASDTPQALALSGNVIC